VKDDITASEAVVATLNEVSAGSESTNGSSEIKESETANSASEAKQGCFYDIFFAFLNLIVFR
jgi:protein TIF31